MIFICSTVKKRRTQKPKDQNFKKTNHKIKVKKWVLILSFLLMKETEEIFIFMESK